MMETNEKTVQEKYYENVKELEAFKAKLAEK
jgi:hypothetical protein